MKEKDNLITITSPNMGIMHTTMDTETQDYSHLIHVYGVSRESGLKNEEYLT